MNTQNQPHKVKFATSKPPGRTIGSSVLITTILVLFFALAIVIGAKAVESIGEMGSGSALKVPDDYATIQAAIDAAKAGDIIQVRSGVYNESLTINKPVTLVAESFDQINPVNNSAIIDGGGRAAAITISPGLTQMPTIRGFVIRNGITDIQAASEFIAEFNYINSATTLVFYQQSAGGFNRNNVYFGASENAINLNHTDRPLLLENNRIMYSGKDGVNVNLQNASALPAMVEVDIWNNMIIGNNDDGIRLINHPGNPQDINRRFVIAGNLIANSKKAGIGLMPNLNANEDYSGADTVEAVRVFNNTFYGNDYGISGGNNLVAFNNIIANSSSRGVWHVQGAPGTNAVIAYSLFHNNRLDSDQSNLGVGDIMGVDPLFEAAPNAGPDGTWATVDDDFSGLVLQTASPAIDKGVAQYIANNGERIPPSPIVGFGGATPDLGWREFGAPIFATPTITPFSSATPLATATVATLSPMPTLTAVTGSPAPTETVTSIPSSPTAAVTLTSTTAPPTVTSSPGATNTATTAPPLTIQRIDPNSVQADTTVILTITGTGFQTGALVTFENGQGLPQEIVTVQVSNSTTILVTINARNDGTFGTQTWDVRVTNPDNTTTVLPHALTVTPKS